MNESNGPKLRTLIGIDSSAPARDALQALSKSTLAEACEVSLATIVPEPPLYTIDDTSMPWIPQEMFDSRLEIENTQLKQLQQEFGERFSSCEFSVFQGHPGRGLIEMSERFDADWIVIGSVGHSAFSRILLGSTSDYVANRSTRTCLVHRPITTNHEPSKGLFSRVVIAISNAESDTALPDWVAALRLVPNCEVHLVHVMETHPEYELHLLKKVAAYMEEVRSAAWKLMETTRPRLEALGMKVKPSLLESPHVGRAVLEYANEHACDLIVVGDQDDSLMERVMLGSVSRFVVRQANQSVLIVR
ncbi:universal stress protein [Rhodopirellula baltica]